MEKQLGHDSLFFGRPPEPDARLVERPAAVVETGVYRGPHYHSHTPMVRIQLDLGRLEEWPSDRIPGFIDALLEHLPGLARHGCSDRRAGGFVRRLREGTWFGHIVEHVALELQSLAGHRVTRGKTRSVKGRPGVYNIMYAYRDETLALHAGRVAVELLDSLLPASLQGVGALDRIARIASPFVLDERLALLRDLARKADFGPTTRALVDEARRRGIPVTRLNHGSLVQLGWGVHQQRLRASITGRTSQVAVDIAGDKDLTKALLDAAGVPVPRGELVSSLAEAESAARRLGHPLVTKPLDGNHGRGVTTDIATPDQLRFGFEAARAHGRRVIVERFFPGRDHRILVINGEVVAAAERVPARVIGDGVRSIRALIDAVNADPRRGDGHEKVMTRIKADAELIEHLGRSGLTLDSIPGSHRIVILRPTANLSTGGTAIDRTNEIHPDNAEIARRAAAIVGLDIAGIDFIAPDISRSVRETGGGVIEVNAAPGFRMHIEPSEGAPRDVAGPVIDMLFPRGSRGRIPIVAITGTNGKSTVARMVSHIFRFSGRTVGLTSTSGVLIDDRLVAKGDATGPRSARMVLADPSVEVAVLETARGGLLREGLAFDEADVAAVLNVAEDHLGLKGIDTLGDLAALKSLITETVARHGASVLNADDPHTVKMARRARGWLIWFSLHGGDRMPDLVREHIDRGGHALVREPGEDGGCLVLHCRGRREVLMQAADIPATLYGMAAFNIANALAAAAIAVAQDVSLQTIRSALATFQSSFEQNPGRLNVYDGHGFRVIVDYAHNAAGVAALGELVAGIRHRYRRVVGVLSIPGDRRDEDILEIGRLGGEIFDRVCFREDPGKRGRAPGEVLELMRRGAIEHGAQPENIDLIVNEVDAVQAVLAAAEPGDLIVVTVTDVEGVWKQVGDFRPSRGESGPSAAGHPRGQHLVGH